MLDYRKKRLAALPKKYRYSPIEGVLIKGSTIREQTRALSRQINSEGKKWHCLIVLNGAVFFAAELLSQLRECTYDTIQIGSYAGRHSSREPKIKKPLSKPIKDRDVLIVEDIVDTGHTVRFLVDHCKALGARSVKVACLLSKPSRREVEVRIDYLCFLVPNRFLVGFGLDFDEQFRNLPFIASLKGWKTEDF
jgi:hypoxanthine phosphoribosyltransferase